MTLTTTPKALADGLATVKPATGRPQHVQALSGVRIRATDKGTHLFTTNLEQSIRRALPVESNGEFDVIVPLADMQKAAKVLAKKDRIALVPNGDSLSIVGGTRTVKLRLLNLDDFPTNEAIYEPADILLEADGDELASALTKVTLFASTDDTRPHLQGVNVETGNGMATFIGTDSYRLGLIPAPGEATNVERVAAFPRDSLVMAAKGMKKAGLVYMWKVSDTQGVIEVNRGTDTETAYATRLVEGRFPNWKQLIPDGYTSRMTANKLALIEATEAAKAFCQRNAPMRVVLNGAVTLKGETPDVGSFEEVIEDATYTNEEHPASTNEPLEIGFNPDFFADALKMAETDEVHLDLISPLRPAMIVAGDDRCLLMPIRLNV